MESHVYKFEPRDLGRLLAPTLGGLALLALIMHGGVWLGWLPAPRPAVDIDRTILIHQAEASRTAGGASIVLIGDSSCLMDVVATNLTRMLGRPVINLATLSYVDLPTHARLVREYAATQPGRLATVVLLMHPESLRLAAVPEYFRGQITDFLAGRDSASGDRMGERWAGWLGISPLRGRILARWLPWPLPGEYGRFYGFTTDLEAAMRAEAGSAIDPQRFDLGQTRGSAEYRLAGRIEEESRLFRAGLPSGIRLVVGVTPTPASFTLPGHADRCLAMLREWAGWLQAEDRLEDLPLSLPDAEFASVAHLNADARIAYTAIMGRQLADLLPQNPAATPRR